MPESTGVLLFLAQIHCWASSIKTLTITFTFRGMVDESGDQFVAYFVPTKETLGKRKRDEDDGVDYANGEE